MRIREMYEYTYYKFYKSMCLETSWGADWRASAVYIVIQACIPFSLILYYRYLFPYHAPVTITFEWVLIPGVIIYLIDHYVFHSKDKWKEIVKRYEAWPRKKNLKGTFIVWGIVSLVIANFILAIRLYGEVDWAQYQ